MGFDARVGALAGASSLLAFALATLVAKAAEPNLFDTISQLPSLQGSTGRTVQANATSTVLQALSAFRLRGHGVIRTLTLLDHQHVMAANVTRVKAMSGAYLVA